MIKLVNKAGRTDSLIEELTRVWKESVRATHLFLSEDAIAEIRQFVPEALRKVAQLIMSVNAFKEPIGFMGVQDRSIEMLFISPDSRGKGIGKELVSYGIEAFATNRVTVNEQNP